MDPDPVTILSVVAAVISMKDKEGFLDKPGDTSQAHQNPGKYSYSGSSRHLY